MRFVSVVIFCVLFLSSGLSQSSKLGGWYMYFGQLKFKSNWNWHNEVQYRNYNIVGDLEQLLLRTGIGYNLTENNNNVLLGYGFIHSSNYVTTNDKTTVNEHRIFQQFITKQNFGRVYFQHRFRFEERFVEDIFKFRFRYFLGFNIALSKKEITENTLYLATYNEIFLNAGGSPFDRNRLYGALGFKFKKYCKLELGYMNQFFEGSGRDQVTLALFANF
jgi:hypothetical protein